MMKVLSSMLAILLLWASSASAAVGATASGSAQSPPQSVPAPPQSVSAPTLFRLDGRLTMPTGEIRTGSVLLVASLYADQADPTPLWVEEQLVAPDKTGRYTITVGATVEGGVPKEFFLAGTGRWIGIAVSGEPEQPRVQVVAVPYALKAAEADTLAGKSLSDFVLAENLGESVKSAMEAQQKDDSALGKPKTEGTGADARILAPIVNALVKYTTVGGATDSSAVYDVGGNVGIGTAGPVAKLMVVGPAGTNAAYFQGASTAGQSYGPYVDAGTSSTDYALWIRSRAGSDFFKIKGDGNAYFNYGNVGIGTTVPDSKLMVVAAANVNAAFFQGANTAGQSFGPYIDAGTNSTDYAFWVRSRAGSDFMKIKGNGVTYFNYGNVGIGTTTPDAKLMVVAGANVNAAFFQGASTAGQSYGPYIDAGTNSTDYAFWVRSRSGTDYLKIKGDGTTSFSNGNVGIGTTTPTQKLHVAGNVVVDGNIGAKYQDVAEWVETTAPIEAGTVVIVDPLQPNHVILSARAYDTRVAGAVSRQPGLVLGEPGDTKSLIAQSGRVRIKVDAAYGAIRPGDLLVTSPTPGYAMLSKPMKVGGQTLHRPGTLLGKALEAMPTGKGEILVLLTLQ